jgi:hypothetical protein
MKQTTAASIAFASAGASRIAAPRASLAPLRRYRHFSGIARCCSLARAAKKHRQNNGVIKLSARARRISINNK